MLKLIATIAEDETTESIYIKRMKPAGTFCVVTRYGLSSKVNLVKVCGSYTAAMNIIIDDFGDIDGLLWQE